MFGKEQPTVTSDVDVGEYIAELERQGTDELDNFIIGEDHGVVNTREDAPDWSKD